MQPGGVLRQSGVLPGIQQAGLRLNNYKRKWSCLCTAAWQSHEL